MRFGTAGASEELPQRKHGGPLSPQMGGVCLPEHLGVACLPLATSPPSASAVHGALRQQACLPSHRLVLQRDSWHAMACVNAVPFLGALQNAPPHSNPPRVLMSWTLRTAHVCLRADACLLLGGSYALNRREFQFLPPSLPPSLPPPPLPSSPRSARWRPRPSHALCLHRRALARLHKGTSARTKATSKRARVGLLPGLSILSSPLRSWTPFDPSHRSTHAVHSARGACALLVAP